MSCAREAGPHASEPAAERGPAPALEAEAYGCSVESTKASPDASVERAGGALPLAALTALDTQAFALLVTTGC